MYGQMDTDESKSINLGEFVGYYTRKDGSDDFFNTPVLAIEDAPP